MEDIVILLGVLCGMLTTMYIALMYIALSVPSKGLLNARLRNYKYILIDLEHNLERINSKQKTTTDLNKKNKLANHQCRIEVRITKIKNEIKLLQQVLEVKNES